MLFDPFPRNLLFTDQSVAAMSPEAASCFHGVSLLLSYVWYQNVDVYHIISIYW